MSQEKIDALEDYTISEIDSNLDFENVVGQDSLTRFDRKKKKENQNFQKELKMLNRTFVCIHIIDICV